MKRSIALSILLAGISVTGLPRAEMPDAYMRGSESSPFAGKSGAGLVAAIRQKSGPTRLVGRGEITFVFHDPFEGVDVYVERGAMPDGYEAGRIVPPVWWEEAMYVDAVGRDLHNFIPLTSAAAKALAQRRPGEVSVITTDFTRWSVGWSEIYGTKTDLYAPPAGMRGRIARAYFYVAALYHHDMMQAEGYMMMKPDYPYLTPYAVNLLCRWNREQAPDENEKAWNDYAARMQGAANPFVNTYGAIRQVRSMPWRVRPCRCIRAIAWGRIGCICARRMCLRMLCGLSTEWLRRVTAMTRVTSGSGSII